MIYSIFFKFTIALLSYIILKLIYLALTTICTQIKTIDFKDLYIFILFFYFI